MTHDQLQILAVLSDGLIHDLAHIALEIGAPKWDTFTLLYDLRKDGHVTLTPDGWRLADG